MGFHDHAPCRMVNGSGQQMVKVLILFDHYNLKAEYELSRWVLKLRIERIQAQFQNG